MYRKILQPAGIASDHAVPSFAGRPRKRTGEFPRSSASQWLAAVLFAAAMLAGCTVGPDYKRPAIAVSVDWRNGSEERESIDNLGWWQLFEDPTLQQLIGAAMKPSGAAKTSGRRNHDWALYPQLQIFLSTRLLRDHIDDRFSLRLLFDNC